LYRGYQGYSVESFPLTADRYECRPKMRILAAFLANALLRVGPAWRAFVISST
jgi:hypothetical protein